MTDNRFGALIGAPNRIDTAGLSGGDWIANSRNNLQSRPFSQAAQSNGLNLAATQFVLTLDRPRQIHILALLAHNLGHQARVRWRLFEDAARQKLVLDLGWQWAWPVKPTAEMSWDDSNWWGGAMDEERRQFLPCHHFTVLPDATWCAAIHCEIDDSANPAGYVRIGRAGAYDGIRPDYNVAPGLKLGHETTEKLIWTEAQTAASAGGMITRTVQAEFGRLSDAEARRLLDLERRLGLLGELVWIQRPLEPASFAHEAFPARLRDFGAANWQQWTRWSKTLALTEIIS